MRVAFSGPSGSGKTTAAKIMVATHGGYRVSFAEELKRAASKLGWDGTKDQKGRKYLQLLGQTVRSYDPLFWVKSALDQVEFIDATSSRPQHIYIDDLRFPNEADELKKHGFALVRLLPTGLKQDEPWRKDPSEVALDGYDFDHYVGSLMGNLPDLHCLLVKLVDTIDGEA